MLGIQKYMALQPVLYGAGIRVFAVAAALLAFTLLGSLNSAISYRQSPSPFFSAESGRAPTPNFLAIEKPSDPETSSSFPPASVDLIMESTLLATVDSSPDPGTEASVSDPASSPSDHKKLNASKETYPSSISNNIYLVKEFSNRTNTNRFAEITDCKARLRPIINKRVKSEPVSLLEMGQILINNRRSSCTEIPRWSSSADSDILRARKEIENAAIIKNHPEVYAPAFKNISMFKRSYELMEEILKVYVYKEGEKPIFHSPFLSGIYSSEGWFMKNMEESRRFRTQDPMKAHLFYLPFSSLILRQKLYVEGSHTQKNLVQYLKNYAAQIAATHPFWNRTGGADHFTASCHDWAPAVTSRAIGRTIRALCNSDLAAVYELGKDVTLLESNIADPRNPERGVDGGLSRNRPILAFFAGRMHGYLRPKLLDTWGTDPDIKVFGRLARNSRKESATMSYSEYMRKSKFCICPRGYEVHSPRVVEAISHGCVPVIISDNFVPPLFEVLKWEEFSVGVREDDIPRLKEILKSISKKKYQALRTTVMKVQKHFVWHRLPQRYDAFHMTLHSLWLNRVLQFRPL